jgi:hypothetical protein
MHPPALIVGHDGGRPSAANVVNPCSYRSETGCAAYDGRARVTVRRRGSLCRYTARSSKKLEMRNDRREVPGRVGRVGGGRSGAGLRVLSGGPAFRRIWKTSREGRLLLRRAPSAPPFLRLSLRGVASQIAKSPPAGVCVALRGYRPKLARRLRLGDADGIAAKARR